MNKIFLVLFFTISGELLFGQTNFYQYWNRLAFQASGATNSVSIMQEYLAFYNILWTNIQYQTYMVPWETTNIVFVLIMTPPKPKDTVFFVHGYLDHIGNYGDLYEFLLTKNYKIIAMDLPGHGLSSGLRTGIEDFSEYAIALEAILQQPFVPKTFFAIGFSTGCSVWIEYIHRHRQEKRLKKLAMVSPLIRIANWNTALMGYNTLSGFLTEIPRTPKKTTSDTRYLHFIYQKDPLQEKTIHLSWFRATRNWHERVIHYPPITHIPLLILQGRNDTVVDWGYNIPILQRLFPRSEVHLFSGEHHLLMETNRREVYGNLLTFLEDL